MVQIVLIFGGITIYLMIMLDAEKMKKMLLDPKYTLSDIAKELNYDSLQALSSDFKKATGMTPSKFRRVNEPEDANS